jgi:2,5-dihydroxypyridine 5,6-dioxygenase
VLFSLGPDTEFGGSNDTPCHLDLPMRHCTLFLDDEVIVADGEVLPREMRVQ